MNGVEISIDGPGGKPKKAPKKEKRPRRQGEPDTAENVAKRGRKALISSIIIGSIIVHAVILVAFGAWTIAQRLRRPEARFEMKKVVKIPPTPQEHKMNVARQEAMAPKPALNDKLVSTRPIDFALPELPEVNLDQMLPLDPSEMISDQVNGLVGSAALGSGLGSGLQGGGGTGSGMDFFGIKTEGDRILLLFDVSASVVNKANAAGVPLETIQEETLKLIQTLPVNARFSMIQFTGNYMPFTGELVVATPGNKKTAEAWIREKWVTEGTMSSGQQGVVSNLTGLVGVLEQAVKLKPDVIFLLSDGSFQWRPDGVAFVDIPYDDIKDAVRAFTEGEGERVPLHFLAFQPKEVDVKEWKRLVRRTGGEFRELKKK